MRKNTRVVLLFGVIVMIGFAALLIYFNEQNKNVTVDGEYNMEATLDENQLGYSPYTEPEEGYAYAYVWICAKNTTGNDGYFSNPAQWYLTTGGEKYYYDSTATYNNPQYASWVEIKEKGQQEIFIIVYQVPADSDEYSLYYDSNKFNANYNGDLKFDPPVAE